nr:hypothetical protein Iba_chr11dCG13060 [Ipomoea batatas]
MKALPTVGCLLPHGFFRDYDLAIMVSWQSATPSNSGVESGVFVEFSCSRVLPVYSGDGDFGRVFQEMRSKPTDEHRKAGICDTLLTTIRVSELGMQSDSALVLPSAALRVSRQLSATTCPLSYNRASPSVSKT